MDIAYSTTDLIINSGGTKDTFYCPSDTTKNADMAVVWCYGMNVPSFDTRSDSMTEPETNRDSIYRVTSYFWMLDTKRGRNEEILRTPKKKWVKAVRAWA